MLGGRQCVLRTSYPPQLLLDSESHMESISNRRTGGHSDRVKSVSPGGEETLLSSRLLMVLPATKWTVFPHKPVLQSTT